MAGSTDSTKAVPNLYHPLDADKQELRLLEIYPSEDSDSPIQVKIFPRRFEDARGQFIPFSYVWGDPTVTETITINGVARKITKNLALFLRQVRVLLPEILANISWEKPALFWADAICINQDDIEERNRQVQLMGSIYGSAPMVLSWLGLSKESPYIANIVKASETWQGLCYKKRLMNPDAARHQIWHPNCDGWMERHPGFWSFSGDTEKTNPYWVAITALLYSPYWRRTWIFQEITLPANTLLIVGSALIQLSSLQSLVAWMTEFTRTEASDFSFLDQESQQILRIAVQSAGVAVGSSIYPSQAVRDQLAIQQRQTLTLIPSMASLHASDPRDKIFGLLGVMDTQFVADYNKPVVQVYSEFVSTWMREVGDLNLLLEAYRMPHIEGKTRQHGLPSWAPDWGAISWALNERHDKVGAFPIGHVWSMRSFQASANMVAEPALIRDSSRILTATGVVCDEVEEVYPTWLDSEAELTIRTNFFDLFQRHTDRWRLGGHGRSGKHPFQVLFRTVLADTSLLHHTIRLLRTDATKFHTWGMCFLLHLAFRSELGHDMSTLRPSTIATTLLPRLGIPHGPEFSRYWREEIFGDVELEGPDVANWQDGTEAIRWAWLNHRAELDSVQLQALYNFGCSLKFLTKNNCLGVASSPEVGDKVVVLAGCNTPVLLRPKDGHYEHIGPCFVLGLMDGEAKEMVDRGEAKLERFEIH